MFDIGFPGDWSSLKKLIWLKAAISGGGASAVWKTVTGTLIHITDALASPVQALSVAIEPQQSGSGDPSPTNVRPITGWTGCEVYARSENLYDSSQALLAGYLKADGTTGGTSSSANKHTYKIPIKGGVKYTVKMAIARSSDLICCWYGKNGTTVVGSFTISSGLTSATVTSPNDAHYLSITIYNVTNQKCALCVGETADVNAIYSGTTLSVTFPNSAGTVYGGTDELISGNIKSEWVKEAFTKDDNYSGWLRQDSGTTQSGCYWVAITKTVSNPGYTTTSSGDGKGFFNVGDWRQGSVSGHNRAYISSARDTDLRIVFAAEEDIRTMAGLKTWVESFAGDDLDKYPHVVYKIKTALEYSHTPTPVNTLQGENNIWADCGDMEITYKAQA